MDQTKGHGPDERPSDFE